METIYSEKHKLRDAQTELYGGQLVYPHERPSRAEYVLNRVKDSELGAVTSPEDFGMDPILAVHQPDFVSFLQTVWDEWKAAGMKGEAIPTTWPARRMVQKCPNFIDGKLGYYSLACETSISEGTWEAAYASAQVALTGAKRLNDGAKGVFSLCRPPGHHATTDLYGGFCFLNNAGIAAQETLNNGAKRVAIVDVDFHHGNGSQDMFYQRDDVLFISLHGDPMEAFPHFLGHADEKGEGAGEGFNFNYPLQPGTPFSAWREALADALNKVKEFGAEALIISLGVDTFENDPISFFKLASDDFITYGEDIAKLGLPTHFVMEGGYDVDEIGINTVNVLQGFEGG
ncbi:histone deacetylase family protein [Rhodobacteraceae bacterium B1Z28]|uniref:Histone deacetylase family protein n=1 Tax=Ruegeria haliotis TaxID=2747601 RepID=A0ABX2PW83_9RHOB|nr:histone deacetylase family protein [Ruegeria haliotis]NVO58465.1 histone deacetylase family protein [Ruegeria haliotis]